MFWEKKKVFYKLDVQYTWNVSRGRYSRVYSAAGFVNLMPCYHSYVPMSCISRDNLCAPTRPCCWCNLLKNISTSILLREWWFILKVIEVFKRTFKGDESLHLYLIVVVWVFLWRLMSAQNTEQMIYYFTDRWCNEQGNRHSVRVWVSQNKIYRGTPTMGCTNCPNVLTTTLQPYLPWTLNQCDTFKHVKILLFRFSIKFKTSFKNSNIS